MILMLRMCMLNEVTEALYSELYCIMLGQGLLSVSAHPKRDKILCFLQDFHPDTVISQ